jgi:cytochrome b561
MVSKYHPFLRILHWVSGLMLLGVAGLGLYMSDLPNSPVKFGWYGWHKSFGMLLLLLITLRWLVRQATALPSAPEGTPAWQILAAKLSHWAFYPLMLAMPISGYVISTAGGHPVSMFGIAIPALIGKDKHIASLAYKIHETAIWILLALVAVHILAVLKHWKDGHSVLRRMV